MCDVVIVETAQYMYNCITIAYVGKELVSQTLTLGGAAYQSGNVDNLHSCRHHRCGTLNLHQFGQAFIRHGNNTYIRLNGAEREVSRLCLGIGEAVEEGRLAHIGQSYYTTLQAHISFSIKYWLRVLELRHISSPRKPAKKSITPSTRKSMDR